MPHYGNTLSDLIAVIQSSQTDAWLAMGEAQEAERLVSLLPEGSPERQALWAMQHVLRADAAAVSASKAAVVAYRAMLEAEAIERARGGHTDLQPGINHARALEAQTSRHASITRDRAADTRAAADRLIAPVAEVYGTDGYTLWKMLQHLTPNAA